MFLNTLASGSSARARIIPLILSFLLSLARAVPSHVKHPVSRNSHELETLSGINPYFRARIPPRYIPISVHATISQSNARSKEEEEEGRSVHAYTSVISSLLALLVSDVNLISIDSHRSPARMDRNVRSVRRKEGRNPTRLVCEVTTCII